MQALHVFHGSDLTNGVDRITLTLISALKFQGHAPHAIVPAEGAVTEALRNLGISYQCAAIDCCQSSAARAELRYLAKSDARRRMLRAIFDQSRPELVHINTGHLLDSALAAAHAGIPVLWHIHSPFEVDFSRYSSFMNEEGYAWMLSRLGSGVVAVSEDIRDSLAAHVPAERLFVVHNGVDVADLERRSCLGGDIRSELGLPAEARLVIGIGRISAQKDFATFARVAECVAMTHRDVYFLIVGPPESREHSDELVRQIASSRLEGRVFALGPRSDVPSLLRQSDLFLSTAIFEGHPLTTLEAMALRKPVVAMACVGLRECVTDGVDGLLAPLGDVECTAKAVARVLNDNDLHRRLREAARETVETRFSSRIFATQFLDAAQAIVRFGPPTAERGAVAVVEGLLAQLGRAEDRLRGAEAPKLSLMQRARKLSRKLASSRTENQG